MEFILKRIARAQELASMGVFCKGKKDRCANNSQTIWSGRKGRGFGQDEKGLKAE